MVQCLEAWCMYLVIAVTNLISCIGQAHFLWQILPKKMSIEEIMCKEKIFQLQSMSNAIICIDKKVYNLEFWFTSILSGLVVQLEQPKNDNLNPASKKLV